MFLLLSLRSLYISKKNKMQFESLSQANIVKYVSLQKLLYLLKCILKARVDLASGIVQTSYILCMCVCIRPNKVKNMVLVLLPGQFFLSHFLFF